MFLIISTTDDCRSSFCTSNVHRAVEVYGQLAGVGPLPVASVFGGRSVSLEQLRLYADASERAEIRPRRPVGRDRFEAAYSTFLARSIAQYGVAH